MEYTIPVTDTRSLYRVKFTWRSILVTGHPLFMVAKKGALFMPNKRGYANEQIRFVLII